MSTSDHVSNSLSEVEIEEWFDAEDSDVPESVFTDEELSEKYSATQIRIVRTSLDFTLHTLAASIQDKTYINISPGYQRRARWDRRKKSLLIESFLMNIPIPPLFLFEIDYNQYEIMDGRQRLEAISEFLDNKYSLTGLEFWPELQGKFFTDLPGTIQRGLLRRTVNAVVLLAETSRTEGAVDIRLVLFRRLNTGGIKLNPQELRNALYPGLFNGALHELSRNTVFCALWNIPTPTINEGDAPSPDLQKNTLYRSMMDCELVLRFYGIRDAVSGQTKGSLRQIFDRTMERYSSYNESQVGLLKLEFLRTLLKVTTALGTDFHLLPDGRPSRPLYDAIMVATDANPMIELSLCAAAIKIRLATALADSAKYDILVGRGNTLEAIKERVSLATTILAG